MNKVILLIFGLFSSVLSAQEVEKIKIETVLNAWHKAAADAKFEPFFELMAPNSIFIGTDTAENWSKEEFMQFCKPYFERGKAWEFTPVQRHVYLSADKQTAWFDEVLSTWMDLCRGSGVLINTSEGWRITHYVLSLTIPNDTIQQVIPLKKKADSLFLKSLTLQD